MRESRSQKSEFSSELAEFAASDYWILDSEFLLRQSVFSMPPSTKYVEPTQ